jgi:predicted DNA-binding transcriptional regulator AlpA
MRNDQIDRISNKLRAMSVAGGCTETEAGVAASLLVKLLAEATASPVADDPWLTVEDLAQWLGLSQPTIFKNVASGWLPPPAYPAPKAPRWRLSWIIDALEAKRALPRNAMAERRQAKLARLRSKDSAIPEHKRWDAVSADAPSMPAQRQQDGPALHVQRRRRNARVRACAGGEASQSDKGAPAVLETPVSTPHHVKKERRTSRAVVVA